MALRVLTLFAPAIACAAAPRPLEIADLAIQGLAFEADSADATVRFGTPDSVRMLPRSVPFGADGRTTVPVLYYRGLILLFGEDGLLSAFDISAAPHRTIRGLEIGADSGAVVRMYGAPRTRDARVWLYSSADGSLDMALRLEHGRVTSITVGAAAFARAR